MIKSSALTRFNMNRFRFPRLFGECLLLIVILAVSPADETMGNLLKAVFVHGALIRIAEFFLIASGAFGLWYLVKKNGIAVRWTWALQLGAFASILVSFVVSLYLMIASWGSINFTEPRFLAVERILLAAVIATAVNFMFQKSKVIAVTGVALLVFTGIEISTAGLVMHPVDPIWTSASLVLKVSYGVAMLLLLVIVGEVVALLAVNRPVRSISDN